MHAHNAHAVIALLAILLSGCATASPATAPPDPPMPAPGFMPGASATVAPAASTQPPAAADCDRTASLSVHTWLGNHKVNDVGTKECDYLVWIANTHKNETIVPLVFQQNMDAFKGTDESTWQALPPIAPGDRYDWQGYVYLVHDPRATIPMARIPKTIVGLKLDDACTAFQAAPGTLGAHGPTVDEPCSADLLLWPDFLTRTIPGPDG